MITLLPFIQVTEKPLAIEFGNVIWQHLKFDRKQARLKAFKVKSKINHMNINSLETQKPVIHQNKQKCGCLQLPEGNLISQHIFYCFDKKDASRDRANECIKQEYLKL